LSAPRTCSGQLLRGHIPQVAGVYAWFRDGDCVYVGKAKNLRQRLSAHRSTSADLSRSTLRASVAVRELGIGRKTARSRPSTLHAEQVSQVNEWLAACEVAWVACPDPGVADEMERRLRGHWMPPLNRM